MDREKQKNPTPFVLRLTACGIILCICGFCVYTGFGKKQLSALSEVLAENSDMSAVAALAEKVFPSKPLTLPAKGTVTQSYSDEHKGVDIASEENTPVCAAADGAVIEAGEVEDYGKLVRLRHKDGVETLYAHLNSISVNKGDVVKQGTEIGKMGSTGDSTGPHLHLEVTDNGNYINPQKWVEGL